MGDYISIIFGSSTATPKAVEYDKALVVGDGSPSTLTESKTYELLPSDWQSQLSDDGFEAGDQLYDSASIFFAASPSPQRLFVHAYLSGANESFEDVPLNYVSGNLWEIPLRPPERFKNNIERVRFYGCDGGTGFQWNYADGSVGLSYDVEVDGAGDWNGQFEFDNGLSGISDVGVVKPLTSDCKITCDFVVGSRGNISEVIDEYGINLVSLALENDADLKNYTDNLFGSQLMDIMTMTSAISGKNCIWFYALPGDAEPTDTIESTSNTWVELKNLIGARKDIAAIKAKPSVLNHDMATGYMAMTVISHPHQQMTFAEPHMGIQEQESKINRTKWKDGQIASVMKRTELAGDPYLITYGFTFGSGDASRIEGTRCQYIIAQTLINNLWGLLAKRETLMSVDGCDSVEASIRGTFKSLKDKGIVDGLKTVYIPIREDLQNNTAAGIVARQQQEIPVVEIEYLWYTSLEKITITRVANAATYVWRQILD
jgi:hypothetical protein